MFEEVCLPLIKCFVQLGRNVTPFQDVCIHLQTYLPISLLVQHSNSSIKYTTIVIEEGDGENSHSFFICRKYGRQLHAADKTGSATYNFFQV